MSKSISRVIVQASATGVVTPLSFYRKRFVEWLRHRCDNSRLSSSLVVFQKLPSVRLETKHPAFRFPFAQIGYTPP